MTARTLFSLCALLLAAMSPAGAQPLPAQWTGVNGSENIPASVKTGVGERAVGDVVTHVERRLLRTARLTQPYEIRQPDGGRAVIPAGAPFFAVQHVYIYPVGGAPTDPRESAMNWCSAGETPPLVCFRWAGSGEAEYARAGGRRINDRKPFGGWTRGPEPKLVERPVVVPPATSQQVIKAIGPEGVVLTNVWRQGESEERWDMPVKWGEATWHGGLSDRHLRFDPVPGRPDRARVSLQPKPAAG